jgi:transcriptional regulator with XRE-family HTH domain
MPRDSMALSQKQLDFLSTKMLDVEGEKLSHEKLAEKADLSSKTIDRLFNKQPKDRSTIIRVCKALGTTIDELESLKSPIPDPKKDEVFIPVETTQQRSESPNATNLVIAAYWQGTPSNKDKKLKVYSKICYLGDPKNYVVLHSEEDINPGINLKDFSIFLKAKLERSKQELDKKYNSCIEPWNDPIIRLFLPVELIGLPLNTWLGSRLNKYSLVLGFSDRYDESKELDYPDWKNNLKRGWQRFQRHAPDGQPLSQLQWLTSKPLGNPALKNCSGFRCQGHWLKHGEDYLENWMALLAEGMPLALWGCEWQTESQALSAFDYLISHNRFVFFEKILQVRQEGCKLGHEPFGVFYEDPIYTPVITNEDNS